MNRKLIIPILQKLIIRVKPIKFAFKDLLKQVCIIFICLINHDVYPNLCILQLMVNHICLKQDYNSYSMKTTIIQGLKTFPLKTSHLDQLGQKLVPLDQNFNSAQYKDFAYKQRRRLIGEMSYLHKMGEKIREVNYTDVEHETWRTALRKLRPLHHNVMAGTYLRNIKELQREIGFSLAIPKINDLSDFLTAKTGFQIKPVPGMIDQREFLNCLAFRVFCSGQFIRHPNSIDCAPEPDLIHDFVGHIPMFADPHIANLSQEIGQLSLGASDSDIKRLGNAYLYTIELGLCLENGKQRAFGAAIASCANDLKKIQENRHIWKRFQAQQDCQISIDDYQKPFECFYLSESIEEASKELLKIGKEIKKEEK